MLLIIVTSFSQLVTPLVCFVQLMALVLVRIVPVSPTATRRPFKAFKRHSQLVVPEVRLIQFVPLVLVKIVPRLPHTTQSPLVAVVKPDK